MDYTLCDYDNDNATNDIFGEKEKEFFLKKKFKFGYKLSRDLKKNNFQISGKMFER